MNALITTHRSRPVPALDTENGPAIIISTGKGMASRRGVVATYSPDQGQWVTHAGEAIHGSDLMGRSWMYLDEAPREDGAIPVSVFSKQHYFLSVQLTKDVSVRDGSSVGARKFVVWRENVTQPVSDLRGGVESRFAYEDNLAKVMDEML